MNTTDLVARLRGIIAAKPPHVTVLADNEEVYPIRGALLTEVADRLAAAEAELDRNAREEVQDSLAIHDRLATAEADSKLCADSYGRCRERLGAAEASLREIGNLVGGPTMTYVPTVEIEEWRARAKVISGIVVRATEVCYGQTRTYQPREPELSEAGGRMKNKPPHGFYTAIADRLGISKQSAIATLTGKRRRPDLRYGSKYTHHPLLWRLAQRKKKMTVARSGEPRD